MTNQRGKITGLKQSHWRNPALAEHLDSICFLPHEHRSWMLGFTSNDLKHEQKENVQSGSICLVGTEVVHDTKAFFHSVKEGEEKHTDGAFCQRPLHSSVHPLLHFFPNRCPASHLQRSACNNSCLLPYGLENTQPTGYNSDKTA